MVQGSKELKEALVDVRKAFRLLCLYQRRMLDLSMVIANQIGFKPYCAGYGFDRPSTVNPSDKWAWDMLPMYRVSFLFLPPLTDPNQTKIGEWLLDIHLVSDSGYPENANWRRGEPDPATFPAVEGCSSSLGLYAFKSLRDEKRDWHDGVWRPIVKYPPKYPADGTVISNDETGVAAYGAKFDLLELSNQEAVTRVVNQFKDALARELQISFP